MTVDLTQYDAEQPLAGQYISPTWQRQPEEIHVSETMAHLFIAGVVAAKVLDWSGLAKRWSEHGYDSDQFNKTVTERFVHVLQQSAGAILMRAAGQGRSQALADFTSTFPVSDWERVTADWSQVYGHRMAQQIGDQSEKGVQSLVQFLLSRGIKGDSLSINVKQAYGLDPRSMSGVISWFTNEKKPRNQTLLDVATSFLTKRAKIIGDVQGFTALNFGRQLTYMEAIDSGLLAKSARKVWVTAIDERVCPICRPMDGVAVGMMDTFVIPTKQQGNIRLLVPPVHPNCRCTVVPEERFRHGIITRTARFRDEGPHHRGRLTSEIEDLVSLGKSAEAVEKFNPLQARDALGRFAPLAGAALAGGVLATQFPRVSDKQPKLPRHLRRVDRKVRSLKGGTYLVPRQYLDFHRRGLSFRAGQEGHIKDMARAMRHGTPISPITLHVYDDVVEVADGNHRVEAAYRAKIGYVPTKIVRIKGKKPVQRGVIPAWRQHRTNEARNQAAARYVGALSETRRNPFRNWNQRLISQDEKKHQWHKTRQRNVKPLPVGKLFNPAEARDKAGRWINGLHPAAQVGLGVGAYFGAATALLAATPDGRAVLRETPNAIRELQHAGLFMANPRAGEVIQGPEAEALKSIFHGFSHSGMTAKVNAVVHGNERNSAVVEGSIRGPNGEFAGQFRRVFRPDGSVYHDLFTIDDDFQGTGFGSAFVTHSFDEYRRLGLKKVSVFADIDVGGYTWASMGFTFEHPRAEPGILSLLADPERATRRVVRGRNTPSPLTQEEINELKAMRRKMVRGQVTPQDIIKVGIDRPFTRNGHKTWAGKELMLGANWHGVFML